MYTTKPEIPTIRAELKVFHIKKNRYTIGTLESEQGQYYFCPDDAFKYCEKTLRYILREVEKANKALKDGRI